MPTLLIVARGTDAFTRSTRPLHVKSAELSRSMSVAVARAAGCSSRPALRTPKVFRTRDDRLMVDSMGERSTFAALAVKEERECSAAEKLSQSWLVRESLRPRLFRDLSGDAA
mmetsp:Transcript_1955/g.4625  ORF Transcript_1955/g.4625 Transcript_1955/m.4625 type:complete len:113 (+) Transcript_1955:298-636(+)